MKQRKTGYIALGAVGLVIIAVIAVMVVGNHSGEKQDDAFSTGVTTDKKKTDGENSKENRKEEMNLSSENSNTQNDDLPVVPIEAEEDAGNTGQRADSTANGDDGTKKESTANLDNGTKKESPADKDDGTKKESPADKDDGTKKESTADKDDGKDTSDKKDKVGDDEKTDSPDKQNDSPADTDKNPSDGTDSIELPFVPAK